VQSILIPQQQSAFELLPATKKQKYSRTFHIQSEPDQQPEIEIDKQLVDVNDKFKDVPSKQKTKNI
jgi:hypothetical protein